MVTMPGEQMSQRRGVKREEARMDEGQERACVCVWQGACMLLRITREAQADPHAHAQINSASVSRINTQTLRTAFRS